MFRRVLDLAVTDGALSSNPARTLPPPRRATGDEPEFEPHPLTASQVALLAAHMRYPVYALVILFLAYTGLRAAECRLPGSN